MFDVKKRIEEVTEQQKELVMQAHGLKDAVERQQVQLRDIDKQIAWTIGALEFLHKWQSEIEFDPEPEAKPVPAEVGGWGKQES